jgi:hypothetical protein
MKEHANVYFFYTGLCIRIQWQENAAKMLHSWILFFIFITKRSIVDPDPHWVRIQWLCRYGSGSGLRTNSGYGYGSIESIRAHIPVCVEQNTYVQYTNCISALKIKNKNEKTCYRVYCTVFFRRKNKILLFNFFLNSFIVGLILDKYSRRKRINSASNRKQIKP